MSRSDRSIRAGRRGRSALQRDASTSGSATGVPATRGRRAWIGTAVVVLALSTSAIAAVWTPAPHTGGDNAGYLALAHSVVEGQRYVEAWDPESPPHTKYPPVYPLLLGALIGMGASAWTAFKALSAVSLAGAALLAFLWAGRRVGPLAGGGIALLALLSHGWLDASRWTLSEPVFLAFAFLALWAADHALDPPRLPIPWLGGGEGSGSGERTKPGWLALATLATVLTCMTRAAGAPLAVALVLVLTLGTRLRSAAVVSASLAAPAAWWLVRSRGSPGAYQSEFWMANPYEPGLGTVGWPDLPARAWANLRLYVGEVVPREWWSSLDGGVAVSVGAALVTLAVTGWVLRLRREGAGAAEVFAPLYLGMILVWPEVWSGERFLLPLYPLLFLYAGEALVPAARRLGRLAVPSAAAASWLVVALPALPGAVRLAADARVCRRVVETTDDVFECHAQGFREFREAATWAGANLPAGSVVLNRKPRIFFLLGRTPGRVFPFTSDPAALLDEADRAGARYVLIDQVDALATVYVPAAIEARPLAFCYMGGWGAQGGGPSTNLLGILPPDERGDGGTFADIGTCPDSYRADPLAPTGEREGLRIPLLVGP